MCRCIENKIKELNKLGFKNVEIAHVTIAKHSVKGKVILKHEYCPWCGEKLRS